MTFSSTQSAFRRRLGQILTLGLALLPIAFLASCGKSEPKREAIPEKKVEARDFGYWMNEGKKCYDQRQANAVAAFEQAVSLQPANADAQLNLANACLLAGLGEKALQVAREALNLDPQSAAARFVAGCAALRLGNTTNAIQFLQECRDMDTRVNAASFQLAQAHMSVSQYAEAIEVLRDVVQWEPRHQRAHFMLSQALARLGQNDEAQQEAQLHARIIAENPPPPANPGYFERCAYTEMRVPFVLDQPAAPGVPVTFVDISQKAFGGKGTNYHAPVGIFDINQRGQNDLLVGEGEGGVRLLLNTNGTFQPHAQHLPGTQGAGDLRCLVGDLNNDRYEDAVLLGAQGVQIVKFATNGAFSDATALAGMKNQSGLEGVLADLDLTGKLDLLLISPTNREPRLLRNLGPMYFKDITATSGIPASVTGVRQILVEDWNGDDLLDVIIARDGHPPMVLIKERGGKLAPTNSPASWPVANCLAAGDLNNDFRMDLVLAASNHLEVVYGGMSQQVSLPLGDWPVRQLKLFDYDNDGWLDILAAGDGLRIWRDLGQAGFKETTQELGLDQHKMGRVVSVHGADFDQDGDSDLLACLESGGLRLLRNDGGNANHQLKLRLLGTRSNASGLGVRIEVKAEHWRTLRTVTELPVEIGMGKNAKPEVVKPRWSDLTLPVLFELQADPQTVWNLMELEQPTGSCPYLYAWDGAGFRFVTDILGASPLGLRVSDTRFVEADPEEYIALGDESRLPPKEGKYVLQVTEELREVLYLDEAKLVAVDHPPEIKVCTTSKMLPGKPFIPHELIGLHHPHPLLRAENHQGREVTAELKASDGQMVSPAKIRIPQLRGLAEPGSVTLDFGPLPVERPLVLVLTGWLRFGGGMANVAGSHDPDLPFPFPQLEVELPAAKAAVSGAAPIWRPVDLSMGVPCGKTKTILVDLTGKLPPGSRRLRISTAFELHWDQAELWERASGAPLRITRLAPSRTDLHWRGFSAFRQLPWQFPLTPEYAQTMPDPHWRITPAGWCTRYGAVDELLASKDNALVLINGGDELTLSFAVDGLPAKPPGCVRDFFFYSIGWDKDSDFHVECGTTVEPFPFHGMDDQAYGHQVRPVGLDDAWITKYNTRWVGPQTLSRKDQTRIGQNR